jgi:hypothetical protein
LGKEKQHDVTPSTFFTHGQLVKISFFDKKYSTRDNSGEKNASQRVGDRMCMLQAPPDENFKDKQKQLQVPLSAEAFLHTRLTGSRLAVRRDGSFVLSGEHLFFPFGQPLLVGLLGRPVIEFVLCG